MGKQCRTRLPRGDAIAVSLPGYLGAWSGTRLQSDLYLWNGYSTVTDFARLRGWSTSQPRRTAM